MYVPFESSDNDKNRFRRHVQTHNIHKNLRLHFDINAHMKKKKECLESARVTLA